MRRHRECEKNAKRRPFIGGMKRLEGSTMGCHCLIVNAKKSQFGYMTSLTAFVSILLAQAPAAHLVLCKT